MVQGVDPDVLLRDILTGALPYVAVLALFPGLVTG